MPDQTPVTDDDLRKAHEWARMAANNDADPADAPWRIVARIFLDTVPAPAKSLDEEIREIGRRFPGSNEEAELLTLADRVEALERARKNLVHNCDVLLDKHQVAVNERDGARASLKRESEARSQWMEFYRKAEDEVRDLKAEAERLRKELGDERSEVHESSQIKDEAVSRLHDVEVTA